MTLDPDVTLAELIDAISRGNADSAESAACDLATWIRHGGYAPVGLLMAAPQLGVSVDGLRRARGDELIRVREGRA